MRKCDDPDRRRAMLRRAAAAWRSSRNHEFVPVFQREWKALPEDEASDLARAIVHDAIEKPDQPIQASYCDQVFFTSFRENTLFSIVHVLRHLDRLFADELIALHPPLAAGVKRYPFGVETMHEEARARSQKRSPDAPPGFFMMGNPSDFPYLRSLMQAERDEDYGPPMEYALERYREDSDPENPNLAPKEFWAATSGFRSILYRSRDAALLEKIPDPDLRLFAQIELAAALVGLPELLGSQRAYRPRPKSPATAAIT